MSRFVDQETVSIVTRSRDVVADLIISQHLDSESIDFDLEGVPHAPRLPAGQHLLVFDVSEEPRARALEDVIRSGETLDVQGSIDLVGLKVEEVEDLAVMRMGSRIISRRAVRFSETTASIA